MKVGIIGSGGREHAICCAVKKSNNTKKVFCIPGNAGTEGIATNINIDLSNFEAIKNFILKEKVDIIIIGPEQPLVDGLVDYLEKFNIKVFGPNKTASQLEGSKIFTKQMCKKFNIPTANFGIFEEKEKAKEFCDKNNYPLVIKSDNLAAGKGVYICNNKKESNTAINEIFGGKFGTAKNVLIEEFLDGEEMSYFIISDGKTFKFFGSAQDHKRVGEGDKGKNTGGMGAYSPSRLFNEELEQKILEKIIKPTLKGINDLGTKYRGFLYAGLMIIKDEPFLIEYNVRMGDPECQTILPTLDTDIIKIFQSCIDEKLDEIEIEWINKKSLCVVLCSNGYPDKYEKNIIIDNFEKLNLDENNYLFHAGTETKDNKIYAVGGRVLNFISLSNTYSEAKKNIHKNLEKLNWEKGFFRKDIGYKVINK